MTQRVAVVTGSNKGIGFAIVRALCKQLDNGVVYLTSRNEDRGLEAVKKLNQEGLEPRYHQLDINDHASITKLRDYLQTTHGGLDILVNNAGIAFKVNATEPFAIQATVTTATNFTAVLDTLRCLVPHVRPGGRIVNVASSAGEWTYNKLSTELKDRFKNVKTEEDVEKLMTEFVKHANAGDHESKGWTNTAYGTTKLGLIALTKVQADKIHPKDDVIMTCCCPGYVATDMSSYKGPKTIDEGADTPVYLVLLPPGSQDFNGKMYMNRALKDFW